MNEAAPKIVSQKEILRAIQKKFQLYLDLCRIGKAETETQEGLKNTLSAFNAIIVYYNDHSNEEDEMKRIPENWRDIGIDPNVKFLLVKEVEGKPVFATPKFGADVPTTLLNAMRNYHNLNDLITKQEAVSKGILEVEMTPVDFEQRSRDMGILWRQRAGIIAAPTAEVKPNLAAPRVLAIENQNKPVDSTPSPEPTEPKIVPRRPSAFRP